MREKEKRERRVVCGSQDKSISRIVNYYTIQYRIVLLYNYNSQQPNAAKGLNNVRTKKDPLDLSLKVIKDLCENHLKTKISVETYYSWE